jgi:hypothetical protein
VSSKFVEKIKIPPYFKHGNTSIFLKDKGNAFFIGSKIYFGDIEVFIKEYSDIFRKLENGYDIEITKEISILDVYLQNY